MRGVQKRYDTMMDKAARDAANAYKRQWRANNRDKVKAYNRAYWLRKAAQGAGNGQETAKEGR